MAKEERLVQRPDIKPRLKNYTTLFFNLIFFEVFFFLKFLKKFNQRKKIVRGTNIYF